MKRQRWLILGLFVVAHAAFGQEGLIKQIEDGLRARSGGAVYDFGRLLKPGGVAELQQLAEQFQSDHLNLSFVTVPQGSTSVDALAESVYQDLNMTEDDVLIVFDGKRVYGKTLALKGEPQAFQDALGEARPAFQLYHAKGLARFAESLHTRIVQKRGAAESRQQLIWGAVLFAALLGAGVVSYRRWKPRRAARRQYDERLQSAEHLFQQVERKMPSGVPLFERIALDRSETGPTVTSEFVRLGDDLRRCRERVGTTLHDVDRLVIGLQALNTQLAESPDDQNLPPAA
jgi:hypothetical protein